MFRLGLTFFDLVFHFFVRQKNENKKSPSFWIFIFLQIYKILRFKPGDLQSQIGSFPRFSKDFSFIFLYFFFPKNKIQGTSISPLHPFSIPTHLPFFFFPTPVLFFFLSLFFSSFSKAPFCFLSPSFFVFSQN